MPPSIRPLAICLLRKGGRILVSEAHDRVKGQTFYRPIGGGIEFGETAADAVAREVREELGAGVRRLRYIGTVENIFTYLGKPGHEIVLVFDGEFEDASLYERDVLQGKESNGEPFTAIWRELSSFSEAAPLYPHGLATLPGVRLDPAGERGLVTPCRQVTQSGWLSLRQALWPQCTTEEHLEEMSGCVAEPARFAAFVECNEAGAPGGLVELSIRTDYVNGATASPTAFVEGLYVVPQARHSGVARRLLAVAEQWALSMGCTELASDAGLENTASHAVHRALGFEETERVVFFKKDIGRARSAK